MIDIDKETLLSITAAVAWLTVRGIKKDKGTLYRWAAEGRLETIRLGDRVYTSLEALTRMAQPEKKVRQKRRGKTSSERYEQAMQELRAMGMFTAAPG